MVEVKYELRRATAADAEALQRSCWTEWPVDVVREVLARVDLLDRQRRGQGIVAAHGEQVLGFGQLSLWPRVAEISDLIVAPAYRGRGIGTAIIRYLVHLARTWRVSGVEIGAMESNTRALALYRRLGFQDGRTIQLETGYGPETVIYLYLPL